MVRVRKLEQRDEQGRWFSDAYAIETPDGTIEFRYSLAWEYLGGRYNQIIQRSGRTLEELEEVVRGSDLRWRSPRTLPLDYQEAVARLDRECCVPRLVRNVRRIAA